MGIAPSFNKVVEGLGFICMGPWTSEGMKHSGFKKKWDACNSILKSYIDLTACCLYKKCTSNEN